jgi:hypothetical protein
MGLNNWLYDLIGIYPINLSRLIIAGGAVNTPGFMDVLWSVIIWL